MTVVRILGQSHQELEAEEDRLRVLDAARRARGKPFTPERYDARSDVYAGVCGGCKRLVASTDGGGSCLWRGGPWHPGCREQDKANGGQQR